MMDVQTLLNSLPFSPGKASPPLEELLWLYNLIQQAAPKRVLEGGAGVTTAVMRLAAPGTFILSIDYAEPGSDWERQLNVLRSLGIETRCLYPRPTELPLVDIFFLDSSAGIYNDGGLGHHLRGQALLAGLQFCRHDGVVAIHDTNRRITRDVRAILSGISQPVSQLGQMSAYRLNLRWDIETGKRPC